MLFRQILLSNDFFAIFTPGVDIILQNNPCKIYECTEYGQPLLSNCTLLTCITLICPGQRAVRRYGFEKCYEFDCE